MDKEKENLWSRRSNNSMPFLPMNNGSSNDQKSEPYTRNYNTSKRFGGGDFAHGRSNPFNSVSPLTTNTASTPTSGASTAFGLGSGAFASFGSATKTPKTPGTAFDWSKPSSVSAVPATPSDKKKPDGKATFSRAASQSISEAKEEKVKEPKVDAEKLASTSSTPSTKDRGSPWPLKHAWVIWYRPPTSKHSDYEKSIKPVCRMETAQHFWRVYTHLKHPSALPTVSDYHFFKEGIKPVWEDNENKMGGKWIMRLKKGVADRYWEDLLLAMVGDQFMEAADEVCGAVLSVRAGEDVLSIWTKKDGGRNVKIRETVKRILSVPPDTAIVWKSHDDSIAQRSAIDQARQEKVGSYGAEKRRGTITEEPAPNKIKASGP